MSNETTSVASNFQHHQLVPVTMPSLIPKMEEWSNVTAYGVPPPAQVTSVSLTGVEKNSPTPRDITPLQTSGEEVKAAWIA